MQFNYETQLKNFLYLIENSKRATTVTLAIFQMQLTK